MRLLSVGDVLEEIAGVLPQRSWFSICVEPILVLLVETALRVRQREEGRRGNGILKSGVFRDGEE